MEHTEIWVTKDKYGKISMYLSEPMSVEGEFNGEDEIEINEELLNFNLTYEESPVKVKLMKL